MIACEWKGGEAMAMMNGLGNNYDQLAEYSMDGCEPADQQFMLDLRDLLKRYSGDCGWVVYLNHPAEQGDLEVTLYFSKRESTKSYE